MLNLLKEAKSKRYSIEYYVKMFFDTETNHYSVYANNTDFNWGHTQTFETLEEAENDFYGIIENYDYMKWEVK